MESRIHFPLEFKSAQGQVITRQGRDLWYPGLSYSPDNLKTQISCFWIEAKKKKTGLELLDNFLKRPSMCVFHRKGSLTHNERKNTLLHFHDPSLHNFYNVGVVVSWDFLNKLSLNVVAFNNINLSPQFWSLELWNDGAGSAALFMKVLGKILFSSLVSAGSQHCLVSLGLQLHHSHTCLCLHGLFCASLCVSLHPLLCL